MKDQALAVSGIVVSVFVCLGAMAIFGGWIGLVVAAVVIGAFLLFETLSTNEHNKKIDEHNKKVAEDRKRLLDEQAKCHDFMVEQGHNIVYNDKPWRKGCRINPETGAMIEPGV
jgi:hypothetical protein